MIRRTFLKRMALAAAACAFIDVPWPKDEPEPGTLVNEVLGPNEFYGRPLMEEIEGYQREREMTFRHYLDCLDAEDVRLAHPGDGAWRRGHGTISGITTA